MAAIALLMASCSERPATIALDDLDRTYASAPCPEIDVKNGEMVLGNDKIPGRLINIKGDNLLATDRAVRFTESAKGCSLTIAPDPVYNSIAVTDGQTSIEIFSGDRTLSRRWVKVTKGVEKSSL